MCCCFTLAYYVKFSFYFTKKQIVKQSTQRVSYCDIPRKRGVGGEKSQEKMHLGGGFMSHSRNCSAKARERRKGPFAFIDLSIQNDEMGLFHTRMRSPSENLGMGKGQRSLWLKLRKKLHSNLQCQSKMYVRNCKGFNKGLGQTRRKYTVPQLLWISRQVRQHWGMEGRQKKKQKR